MSSSKVKRVFNWDLFQERSGLPGVQNLLSPASEAGALIQSQKVAQVDELQRALNVQQAHLEALVRQAILVHQLATKLQDMEAKLTPDALPKGYRGLRITKDMMLDALKNAEITIEDPLGKTYEQIKEYVEIEGWIEREDLTERIAIQVQEPIVMYQAALIHPGKVIMGQPVDNDAHSSDA